MKIAPLIDAIKAAQGEGSTLTFRLIHTGQHYDKNMSDRFFQELGIPHPDVNLGAGGGTQAQQTAAIMQGYETLLIEQPKPNLCLVVGDVTSTMACAIVAQKMGVKVAHVEAGIRSGDWSMPEEINRLVTDSITNFFFTTTTWASENLLRSGIEPERIFLVGNTMIDTLLKHQPRFHPPALWDALNLRPGNYLVVTLHRPANVDHPEVLRALLYEMLGHSEDLPLVFPVHPRTARLLEGLGVHHPRLHLTEPMGYLAFNYLVQHARAVITDSGGITEETTVMGIPCMTLRANTERPETVSLGTNELLGTDPTALAPALKRLFSGKWKKGSVPPLWDGKAATRIVDHLHALLGA